MSAVVMPAPDLVPVIDRIVARHGSDILAERARLFALLRDHAPGETRAARVLIAALDAGTPARLAAAGGLPAQADVAREVAAIVDAYGSSPDSARAAVETWARVVLRPRVEPSTSSAPTPVQPLPGVQLLPGVQPVSPSAQIGRRSGLTWGAALAALLVVLFAALRVSGVV